MNTLDYVPIFKGGNPDEAGNYRGITLMNILGKIYSQILLIRLNKWAEREKKKDFRHSIRFSKR